MAQEKEIKIQLRIPLNVFLKRIQTKGFKLLNTIKQTDIYFDTRDWHLYENLAALRLRQIKGKDYSFSFKKLFFIPKEKNNYYIEEIEVNFPLKDIPKLKEIFERLEISFNRNVITDGKGITYYLSKNGYYDEQKMQKTRRVYLNGDDEITIDDVDKVGIIVELECLKNNPLDVVTTLLADNEWTRDVEGTSYIWLKNVKGLTSHLSNLDKFKTKPDWNVWENERDMYSKIIDGQL